MHSTKEVIRGSLDVKLLRQLVTLIFPASKRLAPTQITYWVPGSAMLTVQCFLYCRLKREKTSTTLPNHPPPSPLRKGFVEQSHPYVMLLICGDGACDIKGDWRDYSSHGQYIEQYFGARMAFCVNTFSALPDARTGSIADDFGRQSPVVLERALGAAAINTRTERSR